MERGVWQVWLGVVLVYATSVGSLAADEAGDQYAVAAGHYAAKRWDLAADEFVKFLADHADHAERDQATFFLGEALVQLGRYPEARTRYEQLLERDGQSRFARHALFRAGEAAYLVGDLPAAKRELTRFHAEWPDDPLTQLVVPYLGEIALEEGDLATATKLFRQSLAKYPQGLLARDCQFGLARALSTGEETAEAERLLRTLVNEPNDPLVERAQFQLGLLYYQTQRDDEAQAAWQSLLKKFPQSTLRPRAELGEAWILYRRGTYPAAAERLQPLLADEQVGGEARYWLGLTERAQSNWAQAAKTHLAAIEKEPKGPLVPALRYYAGDSLLKAGDRAGAEKQFDALLKSGPTSEWADDCLYGKLQAAVEAKQYQAADKLAQQFQQQFAKSPLAADVELLRAAALTRLEQYALCAECLQNYLRDHAETPQAAGALAELVICQVRLNDLDAARATFARLAKAFPDHKLIGPTTHHLAEAAYAAGDRAAAGELFQRMTAAGNPPAMVAKGLSGLAWSKLKADDLDGSVTLFEKLLKDFPDSPLASEAALTRGQIFQQRGQADAALAMYKIVLDKYPNSRELPEALLQAAQLTGKLGQHEQADTYFKQLIEQHPEFAQLDAALYGRAWTLGELGQAEAAEQHFQRIYADFPASTYWADATLRLAQRAEQQKQDARAGELLTQLVEKHPDQEVLAHALYLQGRLALRAERWKEAEDPLTRLVREIPASPLRLPAEYSLAEAAFRSNQLDRAGELFDALARQIEGRDETWLAMIPLRQAQMRAKQSRWKEAQHVAETIAARFPKFDQLYEVDYLLGRCHAAQAEFDAARKAYQAVVKSPVGGKTETAAMAQWMIGETYFHQKQFEQARREYLRTDILYAYPHWQAAALLQAGKCQESLGQWNEARATYQELLKKYPAESFAPEATQRLKVTEQRAAAATGR